MVETGEEKEVSKRFEGKTRTSLQVLGRVPPTTPSNHVRYHPKGRATYTLESRGRGDLAASGERDEFREDGGRHCWVCVV